MAAYGTFFNALPLSVFTCFLFNIFGQHLTPATAHRLGGGVVCTLSYVTYQMFLFRDP